MSDEWEEFDLNVSLLRGIYSYGFEKPSPIQKKAIPEIMKNKDIIAQSQSGTGKTGAFSIGLLNDVKIISDDLQSIILSPTRELSKQIYDFIKHISKMMKGLRVALIIGGSSIDDDIKNLNDNPHLIVACPGRINDMIRRKKINIKTVRKVVLDEADEMLSTGFKDQVYEIFQNLNDDVQICLFTATISDQLTQLSNKFMRDPIRLLVKTDMLTLEGISQYYVFLGSDKEKYETLKDLFSLISMSQSIIYCNSVTRVVELYNEMVKDNFPVCCIHSSQTKEQRTKSYNEFKSGKQRVLLSTNLTARGIDVQQVSTVINFDIPKDKHVYLHRIGRSGRWGRKGVGINFLTRKETKLLREIECYYQTEINELPEDFNKN